MSKIRYPLFATGFPVNFPITYYFHSFPLVNAPYGNYAFSFDEFSLSNRDVEASLFTFSQELPCYKKEIWLSWKEEKYNDYGKLIFAATYEMKGFFYSCPFTLPVYYSGGKQYFYITDLRSGSGISCPV